MTMQQNSPDSDPNRLVSAIFASAGRFVMPRHEAEQDALTYYEMSDDEILRAQQRGEINPAPGIVS